MKKELFVQFSVPLPERFGAMRLAPSVLKSMRFSRVFSCCGFKWSRKPS